MCVPCWRGKRVLKGSSTSEGSWEMMKIRIPSRPSILRDSRPSFNDSFSVSSSNSLQTSLYYKLQCYHHLHGISLPLHPPQPSSWTLLLPPLTLATTVASSSTSRLEVPSTSVSSRTAPPSKSPVVLNSLSMLKLTDLLSERTRATRQNSTDSVSSTASTSTAKSSH
jgi:hypothetical protein